MLSYLAASYALPLETKIATHLEVEEASIGTSRHPQDVELTNDYGGLALPTLILHMFTIWVRAQ